jgi:hypothetical protein
MPNESSLVRFPDGSVRGPFTGQLLESALRNGGGWKVNAEGKPEEKPAMRWAFPKAWQAEVTPVSDFGVEAQRKQEQRK